MSVIRSHIIFTCSNYGLYPLLDVLLPVFKTSVVPFIIIGFIDIKP